MKLRPRVFKFLDNNDVSNVTAVYKQFPDDDRPTLKTYYHTWKRNNIGKLPSNIILNIDTIKEMEIAIHQIKDPDKRATQISRLHAMKLRPIVNKNKKSIKEILDGV